MTKISSSCASCVSISCAGRAHPPALQGVRRAAVWSATCARAEQPRRAALSCQSLETWAHNLLESGLQKNQRGLGRVLLGKCVGMGEGPARGSGRPVAGAFSA